MMICASPLPWPEQFDLIARNKVLKTENAHTKAKEISASKSHHRSRLGIMLLLLSNPPGRTDDVAGAAQRAVDCFAQKTGLKNAP